MKKFLYIVSFLLITLISFSIIYLSFFGIETSRFNSFVIKEIQKKENELNLGIKKIKIKIDLKNLNLFLSTSNPEIAYQNIEIPVREVKIYLRLLSLLKQKPKIKSAQFSIDKFDIKNLQQVALKLKPTNFKSYLLNNVKEGIIQKSNIEINFNNNSTIEDYKINGTIEKTKIIINKDTSINNLGLNFILSKNLILINSIKADYKNILISNGSIDINREKIVEIKGKFDSTFELNADKLKKLFSGQSINFFSDNLIKTKGDSLHQFDIKLDKTLKVIDYNYTATGKISDSEIILGQDLKSNIISNAIKKIFFKKINFEINYNKKEKNLLSASGLYKTNKSNFKNFKFNNNLKKINSLFNIELDLSENIFIELLNLKSDNKKKSNIVIEFQSQKNSFLIKKFKFSEGNNLILVNNLKINKDQQVEKFDKIKIRTDKNGIENNNFTINYQNKKISIKGKSYDATHLLKNINKGGKSDILNKISSNIEINFSNLITQSLTPVTNFNLIGKIQKGKFIKINSKGQFSDNQFLDISLKEDENKKKILEIYSDLPKALLSDYKFFEGINGGQLLFTSVFDKEESQSKLVIENFKVIKAPAFATLLTLADLGGVADLLSGEGMSFDNIEINLNEDKNVITIEEILALGPSVSVLMDGYIEKNSGLVSLSGTMVPAKMLNSLISKIPVVGNILVGQQAGEGIFGVSFKMKGMPDKIKTTVNPVKTLTPRFITRALEKIKKK